MSKSMSNCIRWGSLAAAVFCGYCLGMFNSRLTELQQKDLPLDEADLVAANTFSEVGILNAALQRFAVNFLLDVQKRNRALLKPTNANEVLRPDWKQNDEIFQRIQWGIQEFTGTREEIRLRLGMLSYLDRKHADNEWIETFLVLTYTHPTEAPIADLAADALEHGERIGKADVVRTALKHVSLIPLDYRGKEKLLTFLK